MRPDTDHVVAIARAIAGFGWTWTPDDLQPLCATLNWQVIEQDCYGATLATDLEVDRPEACVYFDRDEKQCAHLSDFSVFLARFAGPELERVQARTSLLRPAHLHLHRTNGGDGSVGTARTTTRAPGRPRGL
ncbi:DUF6301 family protein [Nocardia acididurans]|uniref:DUF6301 family protein n=1 Tax=Nocardia acididurans TaxID=2802282 RepID=UPI003557AF7E